MLKVRSNNGVKEQCQYQNRDCSQQAQHSPEVTEDLEVWKLVFICEDWFELTRVLFLMFCSLIKWTRQHKQCIKHKRSEDWCEDEEGETEVIVRSWVYNLTHNWSHHAAQSSKGRAESQIYELLLWVYQSYYWITCYRKRSIANSFKSTESKRNASKQLTIPKFKLESDNGLLNWLKSARKYDWRMLTHF